MKNYLGLIMVGVFVVAAVVIFVIQVVGGGDGEMDVAVTPLSEFKTTELHAAVDAGEMEKVKELVANGANLESMNVNGETALIMAVQRDHVDVARWLLEQGAVMTYVYKREETPEMREKIKKEHEDMMSGVTPNVEELYDDLPDDLREEILSETNMNELADDVVDLHFAQQR